MTSWRRVTPRVNIGYMLKKKNILEVLMYYQSKVPVDLVRVLGVWEPLLASYMPNENQKRCTCDLKRGQGLISNLPEF